jgi:hypothetical protein
MQRIEIWYKCYAPSWNGSLLEKGDGDELSVSLMRGFRTWELELKMEDAIAIVLRYPC